MGFDFNKQPTPDQIARTIQAAQALQMNAPRRQRTREDQLEEIATSRAVNRMKIALQLFSYGKVETIEDGFKQALLWTSYLEQIVIPEEIALLESKTKE